MSKLHFLTAVALTSSALSAPLHAGTVQLLAVAETENNSLQDVVGPLDLADLPSGDSALAQLGGSDPDRPAVLSSARVIPEENSHRIGASALLSSLDQNGSRSSEAEIIETHRYVADTAGFISLSYSLVGVHNIFTNLGDPKDFYSYTVRIGIETDNNGSASTYSTVFDDSAVLNDPTGNVAINLGTSLGVEANEEFSITMELQSMLSVETDTPTIFTGSLGLDGVWSLRSDGEFSEIPDDIVRPAPVPLPAGLPLLITGALCLGVTTRRKRG